MAELKSIAALNDQNVKSQKYSDALKKYVKNQSASDLKSFVEHMLDEKTPVVISRTLLTNFVESLKELPEELHKSVGIFNWQLISFSRSCTGSYSTKTRCL
jgi:Ni,Fe-hydrogenase III component G